MTSFIAENWWKLFIACFGVLTITSLCMNVVARNFFIGVRPFSIFDLELPVSERALYSLLSQIPKKARAALRTHLWIDFLFMPAAYLGITLLCYKTSMKMEHAGKWIFTGLAIMQLIPWLFDILENIFLLLKLSTVTPGETKETGGGFGFFQFLVKTKFAISLTGFVCSIFGLLYFWIVGRYEKSSLLYLLIVLGLIVIFSVVNSKIKNPVPVEVEA
jgi:hypothetical protein